MPTIHLVRHGRAAAGYHSHRDPGLDDVGRAQAEATAEALATELDAPVPIYTSPLARARETAAALASRWGVEPILEPRVAEIPAPTADLAQRARWLRGVMARPWANMPTEALAWRQSAIDCVLALEGDAVVFCHFVVINALVGAALGAEELIVFRPDNGSVTRLGVGPSAGEREGLAPRLEERGELTLLRQGRAAQTRVN